MAEDFSGYAPGAVPEGTIRLGLEPDASPYTPASIEPPAPVPQPAGGLMDRAWRSLGEVPSSIWRDITMPSPTETGMPPTPSPFFAGLAHGARETIDQGAAALASGAESVFGKGLVSNLPGYRSAEDIRGDIKQRAADYRANPINEADTTPAAIGQGLGTSLVVGGPLIKAGRLIGGAVSTAVPAAARAIQYLGGGAAAAPGATLPARLATRGASLAAQGAEVGGATAALKADPAKPFLPQVASGAAEGAVAAPAVGSAIAGLSYPLRAALGQLPNMVRQNVAGLADRFVNRYGIQLDPTQITQNPTFKIMADQGGKLPFSGAGARIATARGQWQQALAGEMGQHAPDGVTPAVMDAAATRIGGGMDAIAARTTIQRDPQLLNDLARVAMDVPHYGLTPDQIAPIRAQARNVLDAFAMGRGRMSGDAYQNLVQTGGPLDTAVSSTDPTVSAFALRIRHALDDAFQRSAAPGDQTALQQLRYQYRVMKTMQPLVEQKGATGDLDPGALLARVRAQSRTFDPANGGLAYTGGGALGDLAHGGALFFGRQPDSGTAARNVVMGLLTGGWLADPKIPIGTATGLAVNRAAQSMMRSPAVGGAMIENTLRPPGPFVQRATPYVLPGLLSY